MVEDHSCALVVGPQPTHEQDAVPGGVLGGVPGVAGFLRCPHTAVEKIPPYKGSKEHRLIAAAVEKGPFSPEVLWSSPGLLSPVCSTVSVC